MAEKINLQEKVPEFFKEIWTGTVDTLTKTEEDVRVFINKLVERGKLSPEEGKKVINELKAKLQDNRKKIEARAMEGLEKTLHMINIPSKNEVDALRKKVSSLSRKVSKLKKDLGIAA